MDKFNRLASHYNNYWSDKGVEAPKYNFNITAIEKEAEENLKKEAPAKPEDKQESKPKAKDLDLLGVITDINDLIDKATKDKVTTILKRIIDDKLRSALSQNFSAFENEISQKIQDRISEIKPKILSDLKTVAPNVDKVSSKSAPKNFTESVLDEVDEEKDVIDKTSALEVYPEIYVKAKDETTGEVFVKEAGKMKKLVFEVKLPKTASKQDYIKQLRASVDALVK